MSAIDTIAASIQHHVQQHHPPHRMPALRDAHPKHHGCVRATFTIAADPELNRAPHGIFARAGTTYHAWVRFSNALKERHDLAPDARGMAVKLMDVEESRSCTQDFLMVSHHVFFAKTAEEFVDFPATVADVRFKTRAWLRIAGFFFGLRPLRLRLGRFAALLRSLKPIWNPLAVEYFSQTPYGFGPGKLMKYMVRPHEPRPLGRRVAIRLRALMYLVASVFGGMKGSHNMLHDALVQHLEGRGARFDFCVQVRNVPADPAARKAVEDNATAAWSEHEYPFRKVAEIEILRLDRGFDDATMMALGQHLTFTPWHHVPDHVPVGSINAARKEAYERISVLRHRLNRKMRREPRADETAAAYLAAIELAGDGEDRL